MLARLRRSIREDGEDGEVDGYGPPLVPDFGFHHPFDFVEMTVTLLEFSQWNCWPDSGGWAQQDSALIDDVMAYLKLRRRVRWEVEHGLGSGPETQESNVPTWRVEEWAG